jgi:TrmH family RNA methyltransferase
MRPESLPSLVRALASPRARHQHRLLVAEGVRFALRAHDAGLTRGLVVSPVLLRSAAGQRFVRHRRREGVPVARVSPEAFRRLSTSARASGLIAVVDRPDESLPAAVEGPWLVLRRVRSAGNLGTLIRSAEAFGAGGLAVVGAVDPWAPDVVRASMGGIFGLRIARCRFDELQAWAGRHDVRLLAADAHGELRLGRDRLPGRVAFVLGDERTGVPSEDRRRCDGSVGIPMAGGADSLNLAQAGTVLLYEASRATPP